MSDPDNNAPTLGPTDQVVTTAAALNIAACEVIVLRENSTTKLYFLPQIVNNEQNPAACVRGTLVFERKSPKGKFIIPEFEPLSKFKAGEGYKLELHSDELLTLGQGLKRLYVLHRQVGVPRGQQRFLRIEAGLGLMLALTNADQRELLSRRPAEAASALAVLLKWVAESPEALTQFSELPESEVPSLASLLGLSGIKGALNFWEQNQEEDDEGFWQKALTERAYILSQAFAYPVILVEDSAYVGGKQVDYKHGKLADFLMAAESTNAALIVEIKTPKTPLLADKYRDGVYPLSYDLTSAIAQVLNYQRNLSLYFHGLMADTDKRLTIGQTRCLVVAGNSSELRENSMKESFELQRERLQGVTIVTYDELFLKLKRFVEIVETDINIPEATI